LQHEGALCALRRQWLDEPSEKLNAPRARNRLLLDGAKDLRSVYAEPVGLTNSNTSDSCSLNFELKLRARATQRTAFQNPEEAGRI
jgi:hypothetical protein